MKALTIITQNESSIIADAIKELGPVPSEPAKRIDYIVLLKDVLDSKAKEVKKQVDFFTGLKRSLESASEEIRNAVEKEMLDEGLCDQLGEEFKISMHESQGALIVDNESDIPEEYTDIIFKPNTKKIKAALTLGQSVPGCRIEVGQTVKFLSNKK